ncbi:MAG TPA: AbrB/MazE/SpoVT family DNA-binding domain-containing protein [Candidatus Nanoarchaeia archaeon]|nr:AbrB/MazE/SpoVT family DNA-binding domain-containing protein [Candidatus Nanoarchaeia archaeon]
MEKTQYPCPCGGKIKWKKDKVVIDGVNCGVLDIEYCEKCGEEYFPEESMKIVESKLKEKGLWGIKRKEVNLWKSGNSVVLRIPKDIADQLDLKPDEKVTLYAEGKKKLVVDL